MKIQLNTHRLIAGMTAVCALAIATTAAAKNPKEVELKIDGDQLVITTKGDENDCKFKWGERREDGCIEVTKNEKSELYFHLKGGVKCGLESGTDWKLNAVYLGGFNSASKPTGGFGFAKTPDADFNKVKADFGITDGDRATGLVPTIDKSDRKLAINDLNGYEYVVWYKIEALCAREDGQAAHISTSDPRVKNGGTE